MEENAPGRDSAIAGTHASEALALWGCIWLAKKPNAAERQWRTTGSGSTMSSASHASGPLALRRLDVVCLQGTLICVRTDEMKICKSRLQAVLRRVDFIFGGSNVFF